MSSGFGEQLVEKWIPYALHQIFRSEVALRPGAEIVSQGVELSIGPRGQTLNVLDDFSERTHLVKRQTRVVQRVQWILSIVFRKHQPLEPAGCNRMIPDH